MSIRTIAFAAMIMVIPVAAAQDAANEPRRRVDDKMILSYTPKEDEGFITQADLRTLGCDTAKASGMYADIPLSGLREFHLSSKNGCVVKIGTSIVELRYAKKDVAELWRSIDENLAKRARKCKSEVVARPGIVGGKSRLTIIPGEGKECGFNYVVEDRGFLYQVSARGSQLAITPEFENLVATKIDALAGGEAGAYDRVR